MGCGCEGGYSPRRGLFTERGLGGGWFRCAWRLCWASRFIPFHKVANGLEDMFVFRVRSTHNKYGEVLVKYSICIGLVAYTVSASVVPVSHTISRLSTVWDSEEPWNLAETRYLTRSAPNYLLGAGETSGHFTQYNRILQRNFVSYWPSLNTKSC
jgi:hypothetical protein